MSYSNYTEQLKGIVPPIPSPCTGEDEFLGSNFGDFAQDLYQKGIDGLYVCGATGEGEKMHVEERKEATEIAVEVSEQYGGKVISHVGATNSRDAVELAKHAEQAGAISVASMPPRGCDQNCLKDYYEKISNAVGIPVLIYYHVGIMDIIPDYNDLLELLDIEMVSGIKFTSPNFTLMKRLINSRPEIRIFNGIGGLLTAGLLYGADGGIGTWFNIFPRLFIGIYQAVNEGDVKRAMELQKKFLEFNDIVSKYGLFPVFETLLRDRGVAEKFFRHPKRPLTKELEEEILDSVKPKMKEVKDVI